MTKAVTEAEQQLAEATYDYCMEHMQEHFTIQHLAARAGVSPTKLKMVYRRVHGTPIFSHIRKEKMHWAAQRLALSNLKIFDIAIACGYDNASKFSAAFRDVFGVSPRKFRDEKVRSE